MKVRLPGESYLLEGLQIVKRAIAEDIFKFVKEIKTVYFIEEYKTTSESPAPLEEPKSDEKVLEVFREQDSLTSSCYTITCEYILERLFLAIPASYCFSDRFRLSYN